MKWDPQNLIKKAADNINPDSIEQYPLYSGYLINGHSLIE